MEQAINPQRKPRRGKGELLALVNKFGKTTGITAKEFCRQHNIAEGCFYTARKRYLNKSTAEKKQFGFIALAPGSGSNGCSLFAEVGGIKLYQAVTADYLKALLV